MLRAKRASRRSPFRGPCAPRTWSSRRRGSASPRRSRKTGYRGQSDRLEPAVGAVDASSRCSSRACRISHFAAAMQGTIDAFEGSRSSLMFAQTGYAEDIGAERVRAMLPFRPAAIVFTGIVRDEGARDFLKPLGVPVVEMWGDSARPHRHAGRCRRRCEGGRLMGEHFGEQGFKRIAYVGHTHAAARSRASRASRRASRRHGKQIALLLPAEGTDRDGGRHRRSSRGARAAARLRRDVVRHRRDGGRRDGHGAPACGIADPRQLAHRRAMAICSSPPTSMPALTSVHTVALRARPARRARCCCERLDGGPGRAACHTGAARARGARQHAAE